MESEGKFVNKEERTPRMCAVESEIAEDGFDLDFPFFEVYSIGRQGKK